MTAADALEKLRLMDESAQIDAKAATHGIGDSLLESISAFSNEPGLSGGYLLLGVERDQSSLFDEIPTYSVVGVSSPDQLQNTVANRCRNDFNTPVRPEIIVDQLEGKNVLLVYVPEADAHVKPVFIKKKGLDHGAFRRIGSTDQKCTEDDLAYLHQLRDHRSYDQTILTDGEPDDLDPDAIVEYRRLRAKVRPGAAELSYSNPELLRALYATSRIKNRTRPTLAGLLLLGSKAALRRHLPLSRVDYIIVPGREWVSDPERRFQSTEFLEPLVTLIPKLVALVLGDLPRAFILPTGGVQSQQQPLIPELVLREAIVNSVMHRSYRIRQPVQVIRFSNRIEIRNPGYSLKPEEFLGEPGSVSRNEKLAAVLHDLDFAETKGSGIRAMREAMERANLSVPLFESNRQGDQFTVTLFAHNLLNADDLAWLSQFSDCDLNEDDARVLVILREIGEMSNYLYRWVAKVDTLTASRRLQRLRDLQLIVQKGKGSSTTYLPGPRLTGAVGSNTATQPTQNDRKLGGQPTQLEAVLGGLAVTASARETLLAPLPESLQHRVLNLGKKAPQPEVESLILDLCSLRAWRPMDLAMLLGRGRKWIVDQYLKRLTRQGRLRLEFPENPSRPDQRYLVPEEVGRG